ncbi:fumarylacetoacetate hydrolase family protein [Melghirimyces algeriensis]|uniref:2-keto-4-pentenoate hydratase/2-oxohepta-3-ene-1,7-dioic acid hydratase (Catechol pathway) n=1 Tax=Melghirimyces algeriensis TaxID=910412 RepID=A0A521ERF8_9BACL|nr:fumarylacetoacetate hydrolase family protein [Melghirimyces algeriensis]SMO86487.1 2-keto-4-pentenoate hydratase/2-oxohepta-3-ene-1,7-dioic acid hydratase (catechol pathway) [Melghirimyces algeriensis]
MKLVTYIAKERALPISSGRLPKEARIGWVQEEMIVDIGLAQQWAVFNHGLPKTQILPTDMQCFLETGSQGLETLSQVAETVDGKDLRSLQVEGKLVARSMQTVTLLSPLPTPRSFRDFYAFEQHVKTARAKRGLDMVPEWYEIPVFYFSNPYTMIGPEAAVEKPWNTEELDYELEVACVIGKAGKDLSVEQAMDYVAGFCILNDWSARDLQRKEMKVGLGPAKGKDFATSLGPWLVTLDELEDRRSENELDLTMVARVNGQELSRGNVRDLTYSFAQMIVQASRNCPLQPGDLIGSGTVGTGCILELGTDVHRWLEPGDEVELEVERLGVLKNKVVDSSC